MVVIWKMSLEETVEEVRVKTENIEVIIRKILYLCDSVEIKRKINGEIMEFSQMQKQKIIQAFQPLKTKLVSLVGELP